MGTHQKTWHQQHRESLTLGQRSADVLRNSMGSWPFVGSFVLFMLLWWPVCRVPPATGPVLPRPSGSGMTR